MTNPLDYTIQDPDAMRYALLQDASYKGGGAVHMEDGGFLNSVYRNVVPAHLRTFGETLMGDRTPITEKNFTPSELDQMRNAIMSSRKDREITNARVFDNDIKKAFKSGASDKELMAIMKQGPSQKIDQSVGYQHYPGGDVEVRRDTDFGHDASIRSTLGRFAYNKDANGNLIATDNYKFTNDLPDQTRPTSDYAGMSTPEKLWLLAKDTAQMGGLETLPSRVGNAFIGADGRPVSVNLGAAPFAHGGAVHKAEGGILDGHPIFQTAQTPFAEYRHSIGMNQGGKHFDEGGEVSQDRMRYELTNPYGTNYERFVPSTNAFSVNEKPASLAYTQHDVPIVTESGGIAPVPRTVHDDRLAEIEKQLDKGVKPDWMSGKDFLQDQAERKGYNTTDTSISALGQNVLAALGNSHILGGAFRALGAPYEAAEKVLGSSMGLDPMTGIIGKTGELHSIPKAGQYAASRAAPVLGKIDQAVRSGYESGAIPQPGLSIKDVTPKALAPANEQPKVVEPKRELTQYEIANQDAQRTAALPVEQGGLGLPPNNTAQDRLAAQNYYDYLHGTQRLDRLLEGEGLDPKRATSGPMPYGTDKPELASRYATGKADTSINDTGKMSDYFQVAPKDLGLRGKNLISVEQSWYHLSPEQQKQILSGYYRTGYANPEEGSGAFTLHPEGTHGSIASKSHLDHILKEERGNPLAALRNLWGESGELYDNPENLSQIFKLAGYPHDISQTNAPWTTAQGVMLGKVRMDNPLRTSDTDNLINNVIPSLREQLKGDRTRLKTGADQWAKESRYTPKQWVDELEKDLLEGKNSFVWTSIPDKVTGALKRLGHDGIIDLGGKTGGEGHQVVIPFDPTQVRSKFAAFNPKEKKSTDLLKKDGGKVSFASNVDAMRHELTQRQ